MRLSLIRTFVFLSLALLFAVGCGDDDNSIDAAGGTDGTGVDAPAQIDGPMSFECDEDYTNVEGPCDVLLQDCDVGYWCHIRSTPTAQAHCVENGIGTVDKGGACPSGTTDCKPGLICFSERCTPYCCPSTNVPCGAGTCDATIYYGVPAYARVCSY